MRTTITDLPRKGIDEQDKSNEYFFLLCMRRIRKDGRLFFEFMLDVNFDTPEAFLEERSIKMMQETTRIFFDIVFKIQKLK